MPHTLYIFMWVKPRRLGDTNAHCSGLRRTHFALVLWRERGRHIHICRDPHISSPTHVPKYLQQTSIHTSIHPPNSFPYLSPSHNSLPPSPSPIQLSEQALTSPPPKSRRPAGTHSPNTPALGATARRQLPIAGLAQSFSSPRLTMLPGSRLRRGLTKAAETPWR